MRERWPMPDDLRAAIVERLSGIVRGVSPEPPSNREITSAAKALISADRLNLQEQQLRENVGDSAEASDAIDSAAAARLLAATIDLDDEPNTGGTNQGPDP